MKLVLFLFDTFLLFLKYIPVPPTNLGGHSSVIKVHYTLKLKVKTPGMSFNLEVELPLTIGTIPLEESMRTLLPPGNPVQSEPQSDPSASSAPNPSAQPAPSSPWVFPSTVDEFKQYPNLPPPSYAESVWGRYNVEDRNDEHLAGDKDFLPTYAMYISQHEDKNLST